MNAPATLLSTLLLAPPQLTATMAEPPPPSVEATDSCAEGQADCDARKAEIRALLEESKVYRRAGSATMGTGGSFIVLGIVVILVGGGLGSPGAIIGGAVATGLGGSAMIAGGITYGIGKRKFKQAQRDWEEYKASAELSVGPGGVSIRF